MSRYDEINELYKPSIQLDVLGQILFVGNIIVAFGSLIPVELISRIAVVLQVVMALLYFVCNTVDDGYFWYIAEKARRKNSIQVGLGTRLEELNTDGYYNNDLQPSILKYAMNTLESNFFTKIIAGKMILKKIVLAILAIVAFIISCICIKDINILLIVSQTVFSTYVCVDLAMLIFYKMRMGNLYDIAYNILILGNVNEISMAWLISYVVEYEAIKAHYKVRLDEKIFFENNEYLSTKWQEILSHQNRDSE